MNRNTNQTSQPIAVDSELYNLALDGIGLVSQAIRHVPFLNWANGDFSGIKVYPRGKQRDRMPDWLTAEADGSYTETLKFDPCRTENGEWPPLKVEVNSRPLGAGEIRVTFEGSHFDIDILWMESRVGSDGKFEVSKLGKLQFLFEHAKRLWNRIDGVEA